MEKKSILAALAGGVTLFLIGGLFYDILFHSFIKDATETASNAYRENPIVLVILLSELITGGLVTLIFSRWGDINTFQKGVKAGAMLGLLYGLGMCLLHFGTTTMGTLTSQLVDAILYMVRFSISGGVIGWILGRK